LLVAEMNRAIITLTANRPPIFDKFTAKSHSPVEWPSEYHPYKFVILSEARSAQSKDLRLTQRRVRNQRRHRERPAFRSFSFGRFSRERSCAFRATGEAVAISS
jgi:hypothetical protein